MTCLGKGVGCVCVGGGGREKEKEGQSMRFCYKGHILYSYSGQAII